MKIIQSASLFYKEGSSDKVYHAQIAETSEGFVVNFQYGRRNSTLQTGTKTASAVEKDKAEKIFQKIVSEKTGKGYTPEESGQIFSSQEFETKKSSLVMQLLNPIEEELLEKYLTDDSFLAQEKMDGERRGVESKAGSVTGVNRKGLQVQLPDCVSSCFSEQMDVDGEIIGEKLFVFDILSLKGKDLKGSSLEERLKVLNSQKFGKSVSIVPSAVTTKEKRALLEKVRKENGEGIVFKKKTATYVGGRPASLGNNLKFKFYKTATFIVGNHTPAKRSVGLILLNGKKQVEVGKVTILPNFEIPKVGSLVEVKYLYAYKDGAVFQPVYLGERTDLETSDAKLKQLIYKKDSDEE